MEGITEATAAEDMVEDTAEDTADITTAEVALLKRINPSSKSFSLSSSTFLIRN
jgi:hypothetical protein